MSSSSSKDSQALVKETTENHKTLKYKFRDEKIEVFNEQFIEDKEDDPFFEDFDAEKDRQQNLPSYRRLASRDMSFVCRSNPRCNRRRKNLAKMLSYVVQKRS